MVSGRTANTSPFTVGSSTYSKQMPHFLGMMVIDDDDDDDDGLMSWMLQDGKLLSL
jgi:hypothetical protein